MPDKQQIGFQENSQVAPVFLVSQRLPFLALFGLGAMSAFSPAAKADIDLCEVTIALALEVLLHIPGLHPVTRKLMGV
jgi:hypothetical protein